ncbi:hypothetical protein K8O93_01280 [Gordonia bronchialis]|uniref:hypothetical protein n=1 Tax=Gordonia bronchialis TaxID=2054 RepID=UPI001CC12B37|nr:hypothetical protein [Gordonia bronchialis]UAK38467.1 hypothetical protein K8O93_01280 [Gordonia bronchialis]
MFIRLFIHGHKVAAGPWPLYRLLAMAMFLGSILQLHFGPPASLKTATLAWFDPLWLVMMMFASALIIYSIGIMGDTIRSAHVEIIGLIPLFGSMVIYIIGYLVTTGVPQSFLTCIPWAIAIFCPIRFFEIRNRLSETFAEVEARHGDERDLDEGDS